MKQDLLDRKILLPADCAAGSGPEARMFGHLRRGRGRREGCGGEGAWAGLGWAIGFDCGFFSRISSSICSHNI